MRIGSFLVLCLSLPVLAAPSALQQAETLYEDMDYQAALEQALEVLRLPDMEPGDLIAAYRLQGLCQSALGHLDEALQSFRRLLAIQPGFRLSADVSPKIAAPFYQAVAMQGEEKPLAIAHAPPRGSRGQVQFEARLVANPFGLIRSVRIQVQGADGTWRPRPAAVFGESGLVRLQAPAELRGGGAYFLEALNEHGGVLTRSGSSARPYRLAAAVAAPAGALPDTRRPQSTVPPGETGVAREEDDGSRPWYRTWWFWTAVGVVTVGAVTGTALGVQSGGGGEGPRDYSIVVE